MKCCLCGEEIEKKYSFDGKTYYDKGNNAMPLKKRRCCDVCDWTKVTPARIKIALQNRRK